MPAARGTIITIMTTTLTEGALYRLLAWLSPSFPVGAYSYSHGLEAAVEAGVVRDRVSLAAWVAAILEHGAGRIDADLFRDAWRAAVESPLPLAGEGRVRDAANCSVATESGKEDPSPRPSPASGRGSFDKIIAIATRAAIHRGTAETALEATAQGEAFFATVRAAWPDPFLDEI